MENINNKSNDLMQSDLKEVPKQVKKDDLHAGLFGLKALTAAIMLSTVSYASAGDVCSVQAGTLSTSSALGQNALACGEQNDADGNYGLAIGYANHADKESAVALGRENHAEGITSTAIGSFNFASYVGSVAVGGNNSAMGSGSSAIGGHTDPLATGSVKLGYDENGFVNRFGNIPVQTTSKATDWTQIKASEIISISMHNALTLKEKEAFLNSIRYGGNIALMGRSNAIGTANTAVHFSATAVGAGNMATGDSSTAMGAASWALADHATALGYQNDAFGDDSTALGHANQALTEGSSAVGHNNIASGDHASAFGYNNEALGNNSVAMGYANTAEASNSSVFGVESQATAEGATAIGYQSIADRVNTVSVGQAGLEKQITNVAAATQATDAVNLAQMQAANQQIEKQVHSLESVFSQQRFETDRRFEQVDQRFDRQGAMSAAMMNMAASTSGLAGRNRLGVGAGFQGTEQAVAVGYQRMINNNTSLSLSGAFSDKESSGGAGVGISW